MQAQIHIAVYDALMSKPSSRLRELRTKAGLTMRELARHIGEDHSNVRYWESSGKPPRADQLLPIAKALGTTVEQLLGEAKPARSMNPGGKMRRLFEAASQLPRSQQEKIVAVLEAFVTVNGQAKAS